MIKCAYGYENADGRSMCFQCKQPLVEPATPPGPSPRGTMPCLRCRKPNPVGAPYCGSCGLNLQTPAPPVFPPSAALGSIDSCHDAVAGISVIFTIVASLAGALGVVGGIVVIATGAESTQEIVLRVALIFGGLWQSILLSAAAHLMRLGVHLGKDVRAIRDHLEQK